MKVSRGLSYPDTQIRADGEGIDALAMSPVLDYTADHWWDMWWQGGDFVDFEMIGRHVEGYPGDVKNTVSEAFEHARAWLDRITRAVRNKNPDCRMVIMEGNHEYRVKRLAAKIPALAGNLLDLRHNLGLSERKIEWFPSWSSGDALAVGHARFGHKGLSQGQNHAKLSCRDATKPFYYYHTEDLQLASKANVFDEDDIIECGSSGCLSKRKLGWTELGGPKIRNHNLAFFTFYWNPRTGYFNRYPIRVLSKGKKRFFISPEGKFYGNKHAR